MDVYPADLDAGVLVRQLGSDKKPYHVRAKLSNVPDAFPGFALRMVSYHSANTVFIDAGRVFFVHLSLSLCAVLCGIDRDHDV